MSAQQRSSFSPEATAAFAEIVARHDRGEAIDFEAEFRAHEDVASELRALHDNWKRLDRLLGGLQVGESAIDELERDLKRRDTPPDEATRADLERLSSPERAKQRYVVRERLARGGMGEIWRVHDADLDRDLAMKVIRTRASDGSRPPDGKLLRRFLFEARLTGRLDHPGIVPVHDIGIDSDGRLYFTMPLVRGRSLAEILELERDAHARKGSSAEHADSWTRSRVLEIILKVCDTLAFAHAQGVVHRDLKPANIMVGRFGETYVMDWGLARVLSELDEIDRGEVLGTPAYMAPEQAKGNLDDVGPRSDVYALGSILYHLLAGRMPYADHDTHAGRDLLDAVRAGPPPKLEDVALDAPLELVAIAKKAMVRSPDGRYADMVAMAADLRAYMEGRVVRAHEQGSWPAARKWLRRNRVMATTLGVSALIVVAGAVWFDHAQDKSATEIQRLADLRRVEELESRAEALWPASPANVPALQRWLDEAEPVADRAASHAAELARLRGVSSATQGARRDELEWQIGALSELVTRLSRFRDPFPGIGAVASVRKRLDEARRIARASLDDAQAAWTEAIASIANTEACPMYRGLVLTPQFGLSPIGRDPATGLWEFAHLPSGDAPTRDANGRLAIDERSAIVLVLVPGGAFHMGSQAPVPGQPSGPRTDPNATSDEQPATRIELGPFFLAKYETTIAQWRRMTDAEPPHDVDASLPQASVSWTEAVRALRHAGLEMPTEAQWEYGCRAGTTSRWWCGMEPGSLRGVANGGGAVDPRVSAPTSASGPERVDSLRANAFGLVHVHGNVAEWTRDVFAPYTIAPRTDVASGAGVSTLSVASAGAMGSSAPSAPSTQSTGATSSVGSAGSTVGRVTDTRGRADGERVIPENGLRSVRGGDWESTAARLRSAAREAVARENHDPRIGVRASRAIEP